MLLQDAIIERIEQLKNKNNMTQYAVSEKGGIPQTTLISIKRKRSKDVGIKNLFKICDAFDITINDFFDSPLFDNLDLE